MSFFSKFFNSDGEKKSYPEAPPRAEQPDVVYVPNDDERMTLAIEKAQDTLWYFEQCIAQPDSGRRFFSLKVRLTDGESAEHIWLTDPSTDGSAWYGVVNNQPYDLKNVQMGQKVGVRSGDVSDWMITEDGGLLGGYTIRAIRDGYQDEEKEAFDHSTGLHFDSGVDFYRHDDSTPEGAVLALEDAYMERNWEKAASFKDFSLEARNMLRGFGEAMLTEDIISKTAETLRLSFITFMQKDPPQFHAERKVAFSWRKWISETEVLISEISRIPGGQTLVDHHLCVNVNGHWKVCPVPREKDE